MKDYLASLSGKKIFLFGTGGYNSTPEYFAPILDAVKENINDSNEVVGSFICQGKVSAQKQRSEAPIYHGFSIVDGGFFCAFHEGTLALVYEYSV